MKSPFAVPSMDVEIVASADLVAISGGGVDTGAGGTPPVNPFG